MNQKPIKKVAILTSGGDAPGMNAAVRSAVRFGDHLGIRLIGVRNGFQGLVEGRFEPLNNHSVSDILNRGGTFLGSARYPKFTQPDIQQQAIDGLVQENIDALIVIGGDGSYRGAKCLADLGLPCIGLPGSIDNDVPGTDFCIGFDTALNTVLESIDRLRDTSSSHHRVSLVEIMGRNCGDLTIQAALGGGVEYSLIPELDIDQTVLIQRIHDHMEQGKTHAIIAITENLCDTRELAKDIQQITGYECRATILGHVQRGGNPSAFDRILATRLGAYAIELLNNGGNSGVLGIVSGELKYQTFDEALANVSPEFDSQLHQLSLILS